MEKSEDGKRLKEEKVLLEREMTSFLKYYRDTIIPQLESRITALNEVLRGNNGFCMVEWPSLLPQFYSFHFNYTLFFYSLFT